MDLSKFRSFHLYPTSAGHFISKPKASFPRHPCRADGYHPAHYPGWGNRGAHVPNGRLAKHSPSEFKDALLYRTAPGNIPNSADLQIETDLMIGSSWLCQRSGHWQKHGVGERQVGISISNCCKPNTILGSL